MILPGTYKYAIIGGGVTGLAAARRLQQMGEEDFIVLEGARKLGGLCRTEVIKGHYLDIGGGHVLHSRFPEVLDWIFEHIPITDFNKYNTKVLINLEGHPVEFPIELNLWQLPVDMQVDYLYSYLNASKSAPNLDNFETWIKSYLGDKIADNYMIPYNKKLWGMDISKISTEWLCKIPKTDVKLILRSIIERNANFTEEVVSHRSFYYPKYGGFQSVIDAISKPLPKGSVRVGNHISTLTYHPRVKLWAVTPQISAVNVINTAPWKLLDVQIDGFEEYGDCVSRCEYLSDVISLWEREPYTHDAHWQYLPGPDVEQHREFYIHNFAPYSKPGGVMTDINREAWLRNDKKWKAGYPLYEHENVYAYPIPSKQYKAVMSHMLQKLKQYNLYGLGRWGQHQYFNTDQCIKQVLEFFKNPATFDPYGIF